MRLEEVLPFWGDAVHDPIILADDRNAEARGNCWKLYSEHPQVTDARDVVEFVERVIEDRKAQIVRGMGRECMTFYVWIDYQISCLCFSLVSGCDRPLPFGAPLDTTASLQDIAQEYVDWVYEDETSSPDDESPIEEFLLHEEDEFVLPTLRVFFTCLEA